jgi:tRNA(Ile2) C34 agmatinyltransferase TiaS
MQLYRKIEVPLKDMPVCKDCGTSLEFCRTCLRAFLRCSRCGQQFTLQEFASELPEALEEAAATIPMDRI